MRERGQGERGAGKGQEGGREGNESKSIHSGDACSFNNGCSADALCSVVAQTNHACTCNSGFIGDGRNCSSTSPSPLSLLPSTSDPPSHSLHVSSLPNILI